MGKAAALKKLHQTNGLFFGYYARIIYSHIQNSSEIAQKVSFWAYDFWTIFKVSSTAAVNWDFFEGGAVNWDFLDDL